jgi:hypothetical protein
VRLSTDIRVRETYLAALSRSLTYLMSMAKLSRTDLVPLPFAARMVYLLAYGVQLPAEHLSDRLNAMAYSLSRMATLYSLEGPSMRALSSDELASGLFRNGAEEFHFIDSRPPVKQIGVTRDDIEKTAQGLLAIEAQAAT